MTLWPGHKERLFRRDRVIRDGPEHIVGTYRLTKYTLFLLDQYFPHHDELCFEEGCRMRDCYLGDEKSRKVLELINGRVKEYQRKFFGRE